MGKVYSRGWEICRYTGWEVETFCRHRGWEVERFICTQVDRLIERHTGWEVERLTGTQDERLGDWHAQSMRGWEIVSHAGWEVERLTGTQDERLRVDWHRGWDFKRLTGTPRWEAERLTGTKEWIGILRLLRGTIHKTSGREDWQDDRLKDLRIRQV